MEIRQPFRQALSELFDERNKRQAAFEDAQRKRQAAAQRLSELRARQELDGVDLAARIAATEREISNAEAVMAVWPDVQAELGRRIADAEQAAKQAQVDSLVAELDALKAAEPKARREFAAALLNLAQVGLAVNNDLKRKAALKAELHRLGRAVDCGDCQLPHWPRFAIGDQSAVDAALDMVQQLHAA